MAGRGVNHFAMTDLTQERLKAAITYEPETGLFRWNETRGGRSVVGTVAGCPDKDGYIRIRVDYKRYPAHRLAFFYMTGDWPREQVDHINLVKSDNRWDNLREATAGQNAANRSVRPAKKELKGAYRDGRAWKAVTGIGGKTRYLGYFETQEEANSAYLEDARKFYGEFARS